jgi:chaperonin cofactor prefoldin
MDSSIWEVIKASMQWVVLPLVGSSLYFVRKYISRVDELSTQVHDLDVRTSVVESKIDDIRDDIKDIKTGVRSLLGKK